MSIDAYLKFHDNTGPIYSGSFYFGVLITVSDPRILVALDYQNLDTCLSLVNQLDPALCRLKVGKEMFTLFGPPFVEKLQKSGFEVFLDLKFHDIPNTVAKAVSAAASMGVWMVNVHASGGNTMLEAAKNALEQYNNPPLLIAVTVLTSLSDQDLAEVGYVGTAASQVDRLAKMAKDARLNGVVCSALEASGIKSKFGSQFLTITPGIRPKGADVNDQQRIVTPSQAVQNGSDYLVIGRPITQSQNPADVLKSIVDEIGVRQ